MGTITEQDITVGSRLEVRVVQADDGDSITVGDHAILEIVEVNRPYVKMKTISKTSSSDDFIGEVGEVLKDSLADVCSFLNGSVIEGAGRRLTVRLLRRMEDPTLGVLG